MKQNKLQIKKITMEPVITCRAYHTNYHLHYIDQVETTLITVRNSEHRIHFFVNYIKDNVLKKYPDMKKITVTMKAFDKENRIHQFALSVTNMLNDLYKYNICLDKSIFLYIMQQGILPKLVFVGTLGF